MFATFIDTTHGQSSTPNDYHASKEGTCNVARLDAAAPICNLLWQTLARRDRQHMQRYIQLLESASDDPQVAKDKVDAAGTALVSFEVIWRKDMQDNKVSVALFRKGGCM